MFFLFDLDLKKLHILVAVFAFIKTTSGKAKKLSVNEAAESFFTISKVS